MDWSDYEVEGQLSIEDIVLEIWRDVVGYEGYYQVSNTGKVKSISRNIWNGKGYIKSSGKLLKQGTNQKGYPIVYLSKNSKSKTITVHRLVAKHLLKIQVINHKLIILTAIKRTTMFLIWSGVAIKKISYTQLLTN